MGFKCKAPEASPHPTHKRENHSNRKSPLFNQGCCQAHISFALTKKKFVFLTEHTSGFALSKKKLVFLTTPLIKKWWCPICNLIAMQNLCPDGSLFFWRSTHWSLKTQLQHWLKFFLILAFISYNGWTPKSATRAIFLRTSFWVWNQKNLLKRFYWMPRAGRADFFQPILKRKRTTTGNHLKIHQVKKSALFNLGGWPPKQHSVASLARLPLPRPEAGSRQASKNNVPFP